MSFLFVERPLLPAWLHPRFLVGCAATIAALLTMSGCAKEPNFDELSIDERVRPGPVFILGFDGLDPRRVQALEESGRLPNFARLRERGIVGTVRSTIPMISPPAWTTVATGVLPATHGIWGFWVPHGEDPRGRYVDARLRLAPTIWEELSERGRTVGIVNVPVTCPPDEVEGFMVAGFPYPEGSPLTYPADLEERIVSQGYLRDALQGPPGEGREMEWLEETLEVGRARRRIGLDLLFERRPDLSFIVFTTPDRIQHHLWKFTDPDHPRHDASADAALKSSIEDIYVWCDDILGEVLDRMATDCTLLVVADHGFGPAYRGISKARLLQELPDELRATNASSRNLFGGDFFLEAADAETRAAFAEALRDHRDPSGAPIARTVHDVKDVTMHGYGLPLGPDVVAEEAEGYLFVPGSGDGPLIEPLGPRVFSGYHRRGGYFGAYGRAFVAGPVRDIDLSDVPAMAFHLLGEPIPRRLYHNIPRKVVPLNYFVRRPLSFEGERTTGLRRPEDIDLSSEEMKEQIEQIRSLGYAH